MYNGIGLNTARGSGTNGYVVKNLSNINPRTKKVEEPQESIKDRKPNEDILLHEKKRNIEVQCMELRVSLEDEDLDEDEIDDQVDALRQKLLVDLEKGLLKEKQQQIKVHEVHKLAEAKLKQNKNMMKALGIRNQDGSEEEENQNQEYDRPRYNQRTQGREFNYERRDTRRIRRYSSDEESDKENQIKVEKDIKPAVRNYKRYSPSPEPREAKKPSPPRHASRRKYSRSRSPRRYSRSRSPRR